MPPTQQVYPTFSEPIKTEGIPPRTSVVQRSGEKYATLVDSQGQPLAKLIPFNNTEGAFKAPRPDTPPELIQQHMSLLYQPETLAGRRAFLPRGTLFLTVQPDLPDNVAVQQAKAFLPYIRRGPGEMSTALSRTVQTGLDVATPILGPVTGAIAGGAVGGIPGAAIGSTTGGAAGRLIPELTRPTLTPEMQGTLTGEDPLFSLAMETLQGGAEGLAGEMTAQIGQVAREGGGAISRAAVMGRDFQLTPEQVTQVGATGPFQEAARLTGQQAFPRIGTYAQGVMGNLDEYVHNALGSAGRSRRHQESLFRNLDALGTQIADGTAGNPADAARLLNLTVQEGFQTRRAISDGMYTALRTNVNAAAPGTGVDTAPIATILNRTANGQPIQAFVNAQKAIMQHLSPRPAGATRTQGAFETTAVETQQAQNLPGSQVPQIVETTRTTGPQTTVSPRRVTTTETGQEATTTTYTNPLERTTTGTTEGQRTVQELPLGGLLHTTGTGTPIPNIPIDEALQLRSAARAALRSQDRELIGARERDIIQAVNAELGRQINISLTAAAGGTDDFVRQLDAADRFTADMYRAFTNRVLTRTTTHLREFPDAFTSEFINPNPETVEKIRRVRAAFDATTMIPTNQATLGGMVSPSGGSVINLTGREYFNQVIQPELRYQMLRKYAVQPTTVDAADRVAQSGLPFQQLLANNQLLHFKPGGIKQAYDAMGQELFNEVVGGPRIAERLLRLDDALLAANSKSDMTSHIFPLMVQTGAVSGAITGATLAATGNLASGALTAGGSGLLFFAPQFLNRVLTDPRTFESFVLGIREGPGHMLFNRFAGQAASQALLAVGRGEPSPQPGPSGAAVQPGR